MGIEPGDLGAHSCRKGVGTTVAAGYTVYSSIVLIYFRAGWSMGGVKDKYLKTENVGNHYVFRCASCLDQLYKKNQHHLPTWLKDEILQYESIPACTSILIDYLFAPIWYHFQYLNPKLHTECRFRASFFFQDIPQEVLDCTMIVFHGRVLVTLLKLLRYLLMSYW